MGEDEFGNTVTELMWESMEELSVTAMSTVELAVGGGRFDGLDSAPFRASTPLAPIAEDFASIGRRVFGRENVNASSLFRFAKLMRACLGYDERWARVSRSAGGALRDGEGAHGDYAHIAIAVLRSLGYAACYINGYLLPPCGSGAAKAHAWVAVHTDSHGWLEVDPMLGCPPDLRHVAIAVGRDRADVTPIASENLTSGLYRVRQSLSAYPLTRTSIPALCENEALAS
jgi:transglutaminase-like putative cysteine protease